MLERGTHSDYYNLLHDQLRCNKPKSAKNPVMEKSSGGSAIYFSLKVLNKSEKLFKKHILRIFQFDKYSRLGHFFS